MPKSSQTGLITATAAAGILVPVGYLVLRLLRDRSRHDTECPYPPGPKGHFLFGNILDPPPDFENGEGWDQRNLELAKKHGLNFSLNIPILLGRIVIIADPQLAKRVLITKNFPKPSFFYDPLEPLIGPKSLVTLKGEDWAGMRRAFNPGFAPRFLGSMVTTMSLKLERFLAILQQDAASNEATNMLREAQAFTSDVIVTIAFGEDWGNQVHFVRKLEDELCELYSKLTQMNFIKKALDSKIKKRMNQVGIELEEEMKAILERRLQSGKKTEKNAKDILSLAISHISSDENSSSSGTDTLSLSPDQKAFVVDQLKTFYFAGHDTTATTIAWAIWELSQHPEALARLRTELRQQGVWSSSKSDPPTFDQLKKCEYLEGVIKEALRLYPPASGISRKCDDPNETYDGFRIGPAYLIVNAYIMHRHPKLWKHPDEFHPQRFIDGSEEDINSKFLPFSKGKRDCIGKHFAFLEAKLAISAIVMRFDMTCEDPTDFNHQVLTNLPKRGAKVRFTTRQA